MARRVRPLDRLAGAQKLAADPQELVWLSASAGTGKTHVLTARVLRLLLSGVKPESILCLTFTKAGAAEMAERVNERLAHWVRMKGGDLGCELAALGETATPPLIERARTLFARVLDAPGGGLRIQTIHAFCQTLLGAFPVEAGLAPGFRPLEEREGAALARRALAELLSRAGQEGRLGLIADVQRLSRRLGEQGAESYLMDCARVPDAMEALGPEQGIEARLRGALGVPLGDVEDAIRAACGGSESPSPEGEAEIAAPLTTLRAIAAANADWGTTRGLERADTLKRWLAADSSMRAITLDEVYDACAKADGSLRLAKGQAPQDPDYPGLCHRAAEWCAHLLGLRVRAELASLLAAALRSGQAFARAYADLKRAAGAVDFDDLIRHAQALLATPGIGEWVRYKLDQSTDHILVDEGQDTNVQQWAIVEALAEEFFAGEGARGRAHRTIFTVGDVKQAIFGFQGTDPVAFLRARERFGVRVDFRNREIEEHRRRPLHRLSLDRSFRSTPPVLELVDRLIAEIGHEQLGLDEPPPPHVAHKSSLPGQVTLWRPIAEGSEAGEEGEEEWLGESLRRFATRLARQVRDWLDDPFPIAGKGRLLRPEDIMILVRKRGDLASLIVARLHAEGVPVAGVDRLRLTAPLAVRDLVSAIRFALQPEDDLNLAGLLVSPLFGLSQDDLYAAARDRGEVSLWRALRDRGRHEPVVAGLGAILAAADFTTPYRFLEDILSGPLDGRRRLLQRLGEEARDPIEELLNAALTFEDEATPSLQPFLDWFDRGEVDVKRDPSAPIDAVRVMTVHGAKGLQAPIVILADATGDPDAAPDRALGWDIAGDGGKIPIPVPRKEERAGAIADALAAQQEAELREHWRLLYVAATRAEERLVIGGALGRRASAKGQAADNSWYMRIDRALEGLGADWVEDALWSGARHFHGMTAVRAEAMRATRERAVATPSTVPDWLWRPVPREARPPRPLAPSAIGLDTVTDPPPPAALADAAQRGKLLHALFERLPALPPDRREAAAMRWLEGAGGLADPAANRELAASACAIIADPAFADVFGPDALAEAPLAAVVGQEVIAGTVDRLLITPARVRVVDFKTGRRVPADAQAAPVHHLRQMGAYVAAIETIFPGRAVDAALLYTSGPRLIILTPENLAPHKPRLTG